jgi:hypothetical protein
MVMRLLQTVAVNLLETLLQHSVAQCDVTHRTCETVFFMSHSKHATFSSHAGLAHIELRMRVLSLHVPRLPFVDGCWCIKYIVMVLRVTSVAATPVTAAVVERHHFPNKKQASLCNHKQASMALQ